MNTTLLSRLMASLTAVLLAILLTLPAAPVALASGTFSSDLDAAMNGAAACEKARRLTRCSGYRNFRTFLKKYRGDKTLKSRFLESGTNYLTSSNWVKRYLAGSLIQRGGKASGPALVKALQAEQHPKALEGIADALLNVGQIDGYKPGLKAIVAESRKRTGADRFTLAGVMTALDYGKPGSKAFRARLSELLPTATTADAAEKICFALATHGTPGVQAIASVLTVKGWKTQPIRAAKCAEALQQAWTDSLWQNAPVKLAYEVTLKMVQDPSIAPLMVKADAFADMRFRWKYFAKGPSFVDPPALTKALFKLVRKLAEQPDLDLKALIEMACLTAGFGDAGAKAAVQKAASTFITDSSKVDDPRIKAIHACAGPLGWNKKTFPGLLKTLEGIPSPTPADQQVVKYLRRQLDPNKPRTRRRSRRR